jgi:hypothetical protein
VSRPSRLPSRRGLRDKRGAVYVEFLAAFMPIFLSFWCLLQSAGLYSAKLVTMHSAYLGARAAAVVLDDKKSKYGGQEQYEAGGKRKDAVTRAVQMGLAANTSLIWPLANVELEGSDGKEKEKFGRDQVVTVKIDVPYRCGLPLADKVVCGFGGYRMISGEAKMVVHGADYEFTE